MKISLVLFLVTAHLCNCLVGGWVSGGGGEDFLVLPALRSLAQAAFAKVLLSDQQSADDQMPQEIINPLRQNPTFLDVKNSIQRTGKEVQGSKINERVKEYLQQALRADKNDCVKRLICDLNAEERKQEGALEWDEQLLKSVISTKGVALDYSSPEIHFQVAVNVGKKGGRDQCTKSYNNSCPIPPDVAIQTLRQRGVNLDLKPSAEGGQVCSVLFIWSQHRVEADELPHNAM